MFKDCHSDPFRRRLDFPVAGVSVAKCHGRLPVTKKLRNDRQWDALHDSLTGKIVAKVMKPHALQSRVGTYTPPEFGDRSLRDRIVGSARWKDPAGCPRQLGQYVSGRRRQPHRSWARLAVAELQVPVTEIPPLEGPDLATSATGQQKQFDDGRQQWPVHFVR